MSSGHRCSSRKTRRVVKVESNLEKKEGSAKEEAIGRKS